MGAANARAEGREAGERQLGVNVVLTLALLAPLAAGYMAMAPTFEALLVPAAYRGEYARLSLELTPGLFAFCVISSAFNPIFQLGKRTWSVVFAALGALATDLALLQFTDASQSTDAWPAPILLAFSPDWRSPRGWRSSGRALAHESATSRRSPWRRWSWRRRCGRSIVSTPRCSQRRWRSSVAEVCTARSCCLRRSRPARQDGGGRARCQRKRGCGAMAGGLGTAESVQRRLASSRSSARTSFERCFADRCRTPRTEGNPDIVAWFVSGAERPGVP